MKKQALAPALRLADLRAQPRPANAVWCRCVQTLEDEHAAGCTCNVGIVKVEQLGPDEGAIVTLAHEPRCPRWVAIATSEL
jgi:hypothetical protein